MDTGKAIFFGLALIALAFFTRDISSPAQAESDRSGFLAVADAKGGVWIIDPNGRAKYCKKLGGCGPRLP